MVLKSDNGVETYYEVCGKKENRAVLLLHGLGMDNHSWYPQKERYPGEGYFLIVPDLLGHGKSSDLIDDTLEQWGNQLLFLLQSLSIESVFIVGIDFGGIIGQYFALNYPKMVDKLIISDSFGELKGVSEKIYGAKELTSLKLSKVRGDKSFALKMTADYQFPYEDNALHYFQQKIGKYRLDQLIRIRKIMNKIDLLDDLSDCTIRSLVLVSADMGEFWATITRKIANALPYSRFVIVRRTRNPSNLINPENFDAPVLKFIGEY